MRKKITRLSWLALAIALSSPAVSTAQTATKKVAPSPAKLLLDAASENPLVKKGQMIPQMPSLFKRAAVFNSLIQPSSSVARVPLKADTALEPDYCNTFDSEEDFNAFTILDANNDGRTWKYSANAGAAQSYWNSTEDNDDWLFSPAIHLKASRSYVFAFKLRNHSSTYHNSLEVKWGDAATPEGMTKTLLPTTTPSNVWTEYTYEITPEADGNFYFGFHENSPKDQFYLLVDSFSVTASALATAPDSVTSLKVTPGAQGALTADLSFNVPTKAIDGSALSKVDSLVIKRDGAIISVLGQKSAGTHVAFQDNELSGLTVGGTHKYSVVAYKGEDAGRTNTVAAWIGEDVPLEPQNRVLTDNVSNILVSWDPFTNVGANGGYVDASKLSVSVFKLEESIYGYSVGDSLTTSEKGATSVTIDQDPEESTSDDGYQDLLQYAVRTNGASSNSGYYITNALVVGPTISAPYKESFAAGNVENGFAWLESNEAVANRATASTWTLSTDVSADNDGGCAYWSDIEGSYSSYTIEAGDECSINTPKLSVKNTTNPTLSFSYYAPAKTKAKLEIVVATPDGAETTLKTIDLSKKTTSGWVSEEADLSAFKNERYFFVKFHGIAEDDDIEMGVDNINVLDKLDYNLAATSISVPSKVKAGTSAPVVVGVKNWGANAASNFRVVLYSNDVAVDTVAVENELASFEETSVETTLPVKINAPEQLSVKAEVVYANDLKADDNTTETKTVSVVQPKTPKVSDLTAENPSYPTVNLAWSAPAKPEFATVTDGFEDYEDFAIDEFGGWQTSCGNDQALAMGFWNAYQYPNQGTAFGFIVFNLSQVYPGADLVTPNPGLDAHTGKKYAMSPYRADVSNFLDNDSWLISPSLSGKAQTISFYVNNLATTDGAYAESYDVLGSKTNTDLSSFTKIGDTRVANGSVVASDGSNWTKVSVDIPEGTKYFAIHQTTSGDHAFLFGVDDVTYESGAEGASDSIVAYNIYRDGELIATVDGKTFAFTDDVRVDGEHVYNVTVVYEDAEGNQSESGFSNDATVVTSIEAIEAIENASSYNVYTLDGKVVMKDAKSLNGLKKGVYIINDKKYILK